jgi:hypothetical protein
MVFPISGQEVKPIVLPLVALATYSAAAALRLLPSGNLILVN